MYWRKARAPAPQQVPEGQMVCPDGGHFSAELGDRCPDPPAPGETLTLLHFDRDGSAWRGWRYGVRSRDHGFCRVAALTCNVEHLPPGYPGSAAESYALLVG